jgi:hypothetical protein
VLSSGLMITIDVTTWLDYKIDVIIWFGDVILLFIWCYRLVDDYLGT